MACKLHPCRETSRIIKCQDTKTSCHYASGEQVSVKCNMDQAVFKEKIPVAFELEAIKNEDPIPVPTISLTRRDIQNYTTVQVLDRSNHDIILPPSMSIGLVNQVQSITPLEQVISQKKKKKS